MAGNFRKSGGSIVCESIDFEGTTLSLATTDNHKLDQLLKYLHITHWLEKSEMEGTLLLSPVINNQIQDSSGRRSGV